MLHILFVILKIIGIAIAVLLGLFLVLMLVALFVPLRYRVDGKCGGTLDTLEGKIRFSWMLRLFSGYFIYKDSEMKWQARIAWKKLNVPKSMKAESTGNGSKTEQAESPKTAEKTNAETVKAETVVEEPKKKSPKKKTQKKKTQKKQSFIEKIKYTFTKICDTIKMLMERKDKVVEFLNHEIHRGAFAKVKLEIIRLIRFLKPRRIRGRIHFGFEDPSVTGKTLAGASMFYPFYANTLVLEPDFEEQVLEGELHIKGCVRGVYAAILVFNLVLNRDIRTTYKNIRKFQL